MRGERVTWRRGLLVLHAVELLVGKKAALNYTKSKPSSSDPAAELLLHDQSSS